MIFLPHQEGGKSEETGDLGHTLSEKGKLLPEVPAQTFPEGGIRRGFRRKRAARPGRKKELAAPKTLLKDRQALGPDLRT